ncbi:MAG TPA: MMPL family transporter [Solirubrobacteraceae bacterium]|nr:MMPL family transporter [Solirubrobacteraceae bacterium]
MEPNNNLAARIGKWSAQHRRTAILGWIAFVVLAVVVGGKVGQNDVDESATGSGESKRGDMIVEAAGFPEQAGEQVLVQGERAGDPAAQPAVRDVISRLERIEGVTDIKSPLASEDGRSQLVSFTMAGSDEHVEKLVEQPLAAVAAAQAAHPGVRVEQFGDVSATKAIAAQDAKDGKQSQLISNVLTLIILLVAFGAVVAAGLPLVLGASAVAGTVGLLGPVSHLYALPADVADLVVIIGLAVGVDYAMFYARRVMEERDRGRTVEAAIEVAAATSGRAVLISGLTVMTAMAGLLFAGNAIFVGFGIGTMLVVAVAVLGSLTFLPAMLAFLGRKNWLEKGRMPFIAKRRHAANGQSRVWNAILTRVLKRPLVSTLLAGGLLVALSIPALGIEFKNPGFDGYSRSQPVIQTYDRLQDAFPGGAVPATTVIKAADVTAAPVEAAIAQLRDRAIATGQLSEPFSVEISPDKTVAVVGLAVKGSGTDAASERSLEVLRSDVVPATVGKLPGAEVAVTGTTAGSKDFIDAMAARAPLVFAFVLSLAFLLLLVTFRSIVVPIKAIVLNLLSVGAAYGILKLVFQDGHGEGVLDFQSVGGIAPVIPLFLFVILFGLSMDYHVFILSRVREAVNGGMSNDDAVAHGIKSTAGVVTSAALVMVAVFGSFAVGSDQLAKQIGIGLAAAILIDATIIRAVLLPATMKLLGERNWYLPQRLGWLPKLEHEPQAAPTVA